MRVLDTLFNRLHASLHTLETPRGSRRSRFALLARCSPALVERLEDRVLLSGIDDGLALAPETGGTQSSAAATEQTTVSVTKST